MVIILMGVSGSGKTTIGQRLAQLLQWDFQDADNFHPIQNIAKMQQGHALTDTDREPWLLRLKAAIREWLVAGHNVVLACSALKATYRTELSSDKDVKWVYLQGSFELIQQRLEQRIGHYMKADLLKSQFEVLEEPDDALIVAIDQTPNEIVWDICKAFHLQAQAPEN